VNEDGPGQTLTNAFATLLRGHSTAQEIRLTQTEEVSLLYKMAYLVGFKPWDARESPPELLAAVEGDDALAPSLAPDLGCVLAARAVEAPAMPGQRPRADPSPAAPR
jgi:hypothetical protein